MYLESSVRCIPCCQRFDENLKPCVGSCTHIICVPCKNKLKSNECPICDKPGAFENSNATVNFAAWNLLQQLQDKLSSDNLWAFVPTDQDVTTGLCHECNEHTKKLRLCTTCAEKDGLIRKHDGKWLLITENASYEREFLKIKSLALCANCVVEGAHEGHKIEVFSEALKWNFITKSQYKVLDASSEAESLKKVIEVMSFHSEFERQWHPNKCVLENAYSFVPSLEDQIQKARSEFRREVSMNRKLDQRLHLLTIEVIDTEIQWLKSRSPSAQELREIEELRSKMSFATELTDDDINEIDDIINERMKKFGSAEAFYASRKVNIAELARLKEEMFKIQLDDDAKAAKYVEVRDNPTIPQNIKNEATLACLISGIVLTRACSRCGWALQEMKLDSILFHTMVLLSMKLRQLPILNLLPFKLSTYSIEDLLSPINPAS